MTMNTIYRLTTLFALTLSTLGADVKFSALPTATSPSTNSYFPIIDLNLLPAAQNEKYLLTNLVKRAGDDMATLSVTALTNSSLTASRAVVSAADKSLASSSVTSTELGYVSGVTSAIQGQIDAKVSKTGGTDNTGTLYFPTMSAGQFQSICASNTVASGGTWTCDFSGTNYFVSVLSGAFTVASSNLATNRTWRGEFWNTQATNCAITWPSWGFAGGKPTYVEAGQKLLLRAICTLNANDTNVTAVATVTQ